MAPSVSRATTGSRRSTGRRKSAASRSSSKSAAAVRVVLVGVEGSALSLAEGGLTFVEGARLAVTGPEVKEMHRTGLRVGTTACLPAQTLSKIKYNDLAVCQDREGYILTAGRGTLILFR